MHAQTRPPVTGVRNRTYLSTKEGFPMTTEDLVRAANNVKNGGPSNIPNFGLD